MCGRFVLEEVEHIPDRFKVKTSLELKPRYNIAPGQDCVIILDDTIVLARWGLIPSWAKDEKIGYKTINAKAETLAEKPAYRNAFKSKRCLIPADGFFEWKKTAAGKVPYFIFLKKREMFAFAGIFDEWKNEDGKIIKSFSIITVPPNEKMKDIHDRMPAMLSRENETGWLKEKSPERLMKMLIPYQGEMEYFQISELVNSPGNDNPSVIRRAVKMHTLKDY